MSAVQRLMEQVGISVPEGGKGWVWETSGLARAPGEGAFEGVARYLCDREGDQRDFFSSSHSSYDDCTCVLVEV